MNIYWIICSTEWCILVCSVNPLSITYVVFLNYSWSDGLCNPGIPPKYYFWLSVVLKLTIKISLSSLCSSSFTDCVLRFYSLQFLFAAWGKTNMRHYAQGEILLTLKFHCCSLPLCCHCKLCTLKLWPEMAERVDFQHWHTLYLRRNSIGGRSACLLTRHQSVSASV